MVPLTAFGRHTAVYFLGRDQDVRDVCPNRTAERAHNRRQGKSDSLDAECIARELLAHPDLPLAFKRRQQAASPDQVEELQVSRYIWCVNSKRGCDVYLS